jgi:hypothetical protein
MDERICINAATFSINLNSTTSKRCMINALSSFFLFAQQKRPPRRYPGASGPRNVSLGHRKKYQIVPCEVDVHQATQKKRYSSLLQLRMHLLIGTPVFHAFTLFLPSQARLYMCKKRIVYCDALPTFCNPAGFMHVVMPSLHALPQQERAGRMRAWLAEEHGLAG